MKCLHVLIIMLVYRHLLTITLTWQSNCVITNYNWKTFKIYLLKHVILLFWSWWCKEIHTKTSIVPIIDRGAFHNYFHLWGSLFLLQSIVTSFVNFSPFYKGIEEKGKKRQIKGKTMAQWINLFRNNSFIN